MRVYEYFSKLADDQSGIPSYTYGDTDQSGAGQTASGLGMLMDHAAKGLKRVVTAIDHGMIRRPVQRQYEHNMLYSDDESIKGDLQVKARGPAALVEKQQRAAQVGEAMQMTGNPLDMQIIGLSGRARMLREWFRAMDIPGTDEIIPSDEELQQKEQQQAQQPDPEAIQAQIDQMEAQTDQAKAASDIELNQAKAERERTQSLLDQVKAWAEANGMDPNEIDRQIQVENGDQPAEGQANAAGAGGSSERPGMEEGAGMAGGGTGGAQRGQRREARGGPPAAGAGRGANAPQGPRGAG